MPKIRLFMTVALVFLFFQTRANTQPSKEFYRVIRIVDGDTVQLEGYQKTFRLIGIDTPESRRNARAKSIAERTGRDLETIIKEGKAAKAFVKNYLEKQSVQIEWDVQHTDKYRRNLAYLWFNGKNTSVEIAKAGYADALTIPPNVRYSSQIVKAVREARAAKRGLWK